VSDGIAKLVESLSLIFDAERVPSAYDELLRPEDRMVSMSAEEVEVLRDAATRLARLEHDLETAFEDRDGWFRRAETAERALREAHERAQYWHDLANGLLEEKRDAAMRIARLEQASASPLLTDEEVRAFCLWETDPEISSWRSGWRARMDAGIFDHLVKEPDYGVGETQNERVAWQRGWLSAHHLCRTMSQESLP
jgi:hypothetical protein